MTIGGVHLNITSVPICYFVIRELLKSYCCSPAWLERYVFLERISTLDGVYPIRSWEKQPVLSSHKKRLKHIYIYICLLFKTLSKKERATTSTTTTKTKTKIPEHPSPILHAPRDNISHKGKSLTPFMFVVTSQQIACWTLVCLRRCC